MKPPLAAAYVDESERALSLRQQHQREPSDQDIAEFPADNWMLGMVLLVYELPRPDLRKLTSGAEVLKENVRLKPLVQATQAAVEERGRTLDED
jgi:hypothetical protein